ncbi:hypothetical protein RFI_19724 [Reticulomyxa filosa]|uniref:Uncharacterized protein n=1 Tax=Reticulomyxa filosa TaxID=46433 RepID=X6MUD2_RETFI|nr:hypothetical protein RFI_19724 [Reticulomyxa filosa]|eukprot:ETO17598.1 hypothetical protein RFI_19724 [Reticulomyxa filosa]
MPRGLHVISIYDKKRNHDETLEGDKNQDCDFIVLFRGIPKFTGLVATDEDEESHSSDNKEGFLFKHYNMKDACGFLRTNKSNGENCKLSVLSLPKVDTPIDVEKDYYHYAVSGSKNTCSIWPLLDDAQKYFPCDESSSHDQRIPNLWVSKVYSEWLRRLHAQDSKLFWQEFIKNMSIDNQFIIMGEINSKFSEHIIPINGMFIEVYALLDNSDKDGLPIHPGNAFQLFRNWKMIPTVQTNTEEKHENEENRHTIKHVLFSNHDIAELEKVVDSVRENGTIEGCVLYFYDVHNNVIGLSKVKSNDYVIRRRLRERLKFAIWVPLAHGEIRGYRSSSSRKTELFDRFDIEDKLKQCEQHLQKGMQKLTFIPGHKEHWNTWTAFCVGFLRWWVANRLRNYAWSKTDKAEQQQNQNIEHLDRCLEETQFRYASLLQQYIVNDWNNNQSKNYLEDSKVSIENLTILNNDKVIFNFTFENIKRETNVGKSGHGICELEIKQKNLYMTKRKEKKTKQTKTN